MSVSLFELFKIGLGPSSSHTVGPMSAANLFAAELSGQDIHSVEVVLYGSLSLTGKGHATDRAVTLGLTGRTPEQTLPEEADSTWQDVKTHNRLVLPDGRTVAFNPSSSIHFVNTPLPEHPNAVKFLAQDKSGQCLHEKVWFSVGGGFIATADQLNAQNSPHGTVSHPYQFGSAQELLALCEREKMSMAELMLASEEALGHSRENTVMRLDRIIAAMQSCIERGIATEGALPGLLQVKRRAPGLYRRWQQEKQGDDPLQLMDWVSLCAVAVNEENAAGGRIVTAPTNGAAGVIPAVISFFRQYSQGCTVEKTRTILLTAAAIGFLYKHNASISAAEVGCQGEIGVASSMAAGGLTAAWGGSMQQVENAAEIAMEHHLGMTCDPVAGLVQVPCIERNAMGANKAISAARLALGGDGVHRVSLDEVIATMYQTGKDMQAHYKETSQAGLAVNVVYC